MPRAGLKLCRPGLQDSPVDKLVDAMPQVTGDDRPQESRTLLARRAVGIAPTLLGANASMQLLAVCPRKLALMAPLWVAVFAHWGIWLRAGASLLRLYRLFDLMSFLTARQEDMASPIRWVAFFKFSFIIYATAHWVGCAYYLLAAVSDFSVHKYVINWVSAWVTRTEVDFNWIESPSVYQYAVRIISHPARHAAAAVRTGSCDPFEEHACISNLCRSAVQVMLFKGFSMLTNLGYEIAVPQRSGELLLAIVAQNVKVIIDAYILGTLFHYLVKKGVAPHCTTAGSHQCGLPLPNCSSVHLRAAAPERACACS